jgi:hypothetical protein
MGWKVQVASDKWQVNGHGLLLATCNLKLPPFIRGECVFLASRREFFGVMVVIKLRLQSWPWGGGDKTPVFDAAARGFVTVTRGTYLKKHWSAILSRFN